LPELFHAGNNERVQDEVSGVMDNTILLGNNIDTLKMLPDNIADCCITSPPYYGLRDYGNDSQIGLEETPEKLGFKPSKKKATFYIAEEQQ